MSNFTYRPTRAIEASTIQALESALEVTKWKNVDIEKTFTRVYDNSLPVVLVRVENTTHGPVEVGSNSTRREATVLMDIFAKNDGQRLDLKDSIVSELKDGWKYYDYTVEQGSIVSKTANGELSVIEMTDTPIDLNTPKSQLDVKDRYRHRLQFIVKSTEIEE